MDTITIAELDRIARLWARRVGAGEAADHMASLEGCGLHVDRAGEPARRLEDEYVTVWLEDGRALALRLVGERETWGEAIC